VGRLSYTDRYVTVRGLRLHYVDYGGNGPAVVAIPGLIQNAHAFDAIAPLLFPHFQLLSLDLPGRGGSDWGPASCYRFGEYLLDLRAFLNALALSRAALIGTSMGGVIARLYATAHPERVTHLVLNDCAIGGDLAGVYQVATRPARAPQKFANFSEALDWFLSERNGLERLDQNSRRRWVRHFLHEAPGGGLRFNCDPLVIRLAIRGARQLCAAEGSQSLLTRQAVQWEQARRLTMPVLLLRGGLSEVVAPNVVERFIRVVPRARSVEVPGVGHSPTLYEPEAQQALASFFGIDSRTGMHM
jgi:pimeloyl-ACP methyl ester carboxylesterase